MTKKFKIELDLITDCRDEKEVKNNLITLLKDYFLRGEIKKIKETKLNKYEREFFR